MSTPTLNPKTPTLISFSICPFVQRSVIALNAKDVQFDRIDIDLANKPEWFLDLVPTGKVPALLLEGEVLFESAVISEFLDESYGTPLLAQTPLARAKERAWICFASDLLGSQFALLKATSQEEVDAKKEAWILKLLQIGAITKGAYYNGESLSLLDTAIAPLFTRLRLIPSLHSEVAQRAGKDSPLMHWIDSIAQLPEVANSVADDFDSQFVRYFQAENSYLLR